MYKKIIDTLQCPMCGGCLDWHIQEQDNEEIFEAKITCTICDNKYIIHKGIACFLKPKYNDLRIWKKCDRSNYKKISMVEKSILISKQNSELSQEELLIKIALIENKELVGEESVTDLYQRYFKNQGMVNSIKIIYSLIDELIKILVMNNEQYVLDFASGRGLLAGELAKKWDGFLIVSDINPLIVEKCKDYIDVCEKKAKVSYIVFDIKRSPFKNKGFNTITTLFGMQNIINSEELFKELGRICNRLFYTISSYCSNDSQKNVNYLMKYHLLDAWIRDLLVIDLQKYGFGKDVMIRSFSEMTTSPEKNAIDSGYAVSKFPCEDTLIEYVLDCFVKE